MSYDPDIISKLLDFHDEARMGAEYVPLAATIYGEAVEEIFRLQQSIENNLHTTNALLSMWSNAVDKLKAMGLTSEEIFEGRK